MVTVVPIVPVLVHSGQNSVGPDPGSAPDLLPQGQRLKAGLSSAEKAAPHEIMISRPVLSPACFNRGTIFGVSVA